MSGNLVPLVVSLVIWGALFLYLGRLEVRVREMRRELDDRSEGPEPGDRREEEP